MYFVPLRDVVRYNFSLLAVVSRYVLRLRNESKDIILQ